MPAASGDTIDVAAGTYTNDFFTIRTSLTLQAVGGEVQMVATQQPPDGKAMITEGGAGRSVAINGFDISGVSVGRQQWRGDPLRGRQPRPDQRLLPQQPGGPAGRAPIRTARSRIDHSEFASNGDGIRLHPQHLRRRHRQLLHHQQLFPRRSRGP